MPGTSRAVLPLIVLASMVTASSRKRVGPQSVDVLPLMTVRTMMVVPCRKAPLDVRAVLPEIVESTMVVGPKPRRPAPAVSTPKSTLSVMATWSRVMAALA